jgi:amidase
MMSDLAFAGVARQAELVRAGEVSARELAELCLERIARHDPALNCFRVVFAERALAEADQADARRKAGEERPLLGVPVAIKDDQDVAGEVTAKGSIAHGPAAREDDEIVAGLRERGAVLIGKTHVPELMTMGFTETAWYGATRNPWDLDRTPGGSSGGSAAAIAAGLVPAATATDGAGSIRIPAACTGLVGLKPGPGVVPGRVHWNGMDFWGFLARSAADAALLYGIEPAEEPRGVRIAWSVKRPLPHLPGPKPVMLRAVESMRDTLAGLGHRLEERDPPWGLMGPRTVARYLRGIADDADSMARPDRLDRRSRGLARLGRSLPEPLFRSAHGAAEADRERLERFMGDGLLMLPVFNDLPPRIGEYEGLGAVRSLDKAFNFTPYPGLLNHTGLPAIALPAAQTEDGFPLGIQIAGPRGSEPRLLALAAQLERELRWADRRPPGF